MKLVRLRHAVPGLLLGLVSCSGIGAITGAGDSGTVTLEGFSFGTCDKPATPLPGWLQCHGTISLDVTKAVTSGYVTAIMNYPDDGSFYHGSYATSSKSPGHITIAVTNQYISQCVTTLATEVDVWDGPDGATTAKMLASIPFTIHATC